MGGRVWLIDFVCCVKGQQTILSNCHYRLDCSVLTRLFADVSVYFTIYILYQCLAKMTEKLKLQFASMRTALTYVHHLIFCFLFSFTSPIHFFQWPHQLLWLSRKDDVILCSIKSTHSHFIQLELLIGTTPVTHLIASWCRICMNHLHICRLHILQGWLWWYIDENCMAKDGSTYLCVNAGSVNEWGESDIFPAAGMYLMWHFCNCQPSRKRVMWELVHFNYSDCMDEPVLNACEKK